MTTSLRMLAISDNLHEHNTPFEYCTAYFVDKTRKKKDVSPCQVHIFIDHRSLLLVGEKAAVMKWEALAIWAMCMEMNVYFLKSYC